MGRKRGAQPGNVNALKHGFYSKRFREIEVSDLETMLATGLYDEIAMLRVVMRRVFEHASDEASDMVSWGEVLTLLSIAAARLANLLRTQKALGGDESMVTAALNQALAEVTREFDL